MGFCVKCGAKLDGDTKFCAKCGYSVENIKPKEKRREVFEGEIRKCPNCGSSVPSFNWKCNDCGFEFRNTGLSDAVHEFTKQLQEIDNKRGKKDKKINKKIDIINNFAIPNTKEDIMEFMILASSNINENIYTIDKSPDKSEIELSNVWKSKMEQVYLKAKLALDEDDFVEIEKIYKEKNEAVKKNKRSYVIGTAAICICAVLFLLCEMYFANAYVHKDDDKKIEVEKQLQEMVIEIEEDIGEGDYDGALIKAQNLYFDRNLDWKKSEEWDEKRETIINLINEKKSLEE